MDGWINLTRDGDDSYSPVRAAGGCSVLELDLLETVGRLISSPHPKVGDVVRLDRIGDNLHITADGLPPVVMRLKE